MSLLESGKFVIKAAGGLFKDYPHYPSIKRRPLMNELASTSPIEPLNREEGLLDKFLLIMKNRGINGIAKTQKPYWMNDPSYDLLEVFGTAIQFMDQHSGQLPKTTLPPSKDIETFINAVFQEPTDKVTIDRQFELLLDISGNDVVGAANIGMLATRLMSRFSDQRAYPNLTIDGKEIKYKVSTDEEIEPIMKKWFHKVARFETFNDINGRNDGTGDQSYFWTHFLAACTFDSNTINGKIFQRTFEKGNEIMIFVKDKFAKRGGTVSSHYEASLLGRHIGLSISAN
ncbi:MAG: hypothetical protein Q7S14_02240 [bacterium]|nr:hypothetical protein [bacterium]